MTDREDKAWLKSCPTGDGNFKAHLKTVTEQEIQELIEELPEQGNITKIKALQAELKRRENYVKGIGRKMGQK